ncbi:MAG TPA: clostripain-related cysteine peptidase, partial [Planctomycetota bacterium]|nr:clostripain-related cysteine peptidase [Planctomycetota bacterium]
LALGLLAMTSFSQDRKAQWTVMVYLAADCDLEADMLEDLREMAATGSTPDMNIVVLVDRTPKGKPKGKYTNKGVLNLENWNGTKLLHVQKGKLRELADLGEKNLGDPAVLRDFVRRAASDFPAKKFALILSDHGMSWPGACADETDNDDHLTLPEIRGALEDVTRETGPFELLGFDACLMANLEVAQAVAPVAKVMVASEELEPGYGWSYTPTLAALALKPAMSGAELGRVIADEYKAFFQKSKIKSIRQQGERITLSVIALDRVEAVARAAGELGEKAASLVKAKRRESWVRIARARSFTENYGRSGDPSDEGSHVYSIVHLAQQLKREAPDVAAEALEKAAKDAVLYSVRGRGCPNAHGLTVYFPPDGETLKRDKYLEAVGAEGKWARFLAAYAGISSEDTEKPNLKATKTDDAELGDKDSVTITCTASADDIAETYFVLATKEEGEILVLGALPTEVGDEGELEEEWDGHWFTIEDDEGYVVAPMTDFEEIGEDEYLAQVPAQVRVSDGDEWVDVTLHFLVKIGEDDLKGELVYAFADTKFGPLEIDLEEGDLVRPVYVVIAADGSEKTDASEDEEDYLKVGKKGLQVGWREVDEGTYQVGFVVIDHAGNAAEEYVEVKVE